ncbi:hypothetical protein NEOKW01_2084 [Nematocida sp. AWRm80]|nr:hypothetical protein NEOKW01_2084 [Nematocida sp. AWRm80]
MEVNNPLVNSLPGQILKAIEEAGVDFNLVVAGEGFCGKTSLIQSLFDFTLNPVPDEEFFQEVCDIACISNPLADLLDATSSVSLEKSGLSVTATKIPLIDRTVKMNLTIYEVSNIGDSLHSDIDWMVVRNLIQNRHEEYHMEEDTGELTKDKRIHCCLYLSNPRNTPREIDLIAMREIGKITNLIPIITKADTFTDSEYNQMKESFFSAMVSNDVKLFDSIFINECKKVVELNFMPLRYSTPNRLYPYYAHNCAHQDSSIYSLRDLLIKEHLIDLVEMTEKYYESYRKNKLIVDVLTSEDSSLDENFKRRIFLEESKLKSLIKRLEKKKTNYQLLITQHKNLIPKELI